MAGRILDWKGCFSAGEPHARVSGHRGGWDVRRPQCSPVDTHARLASSLLGTRLQLWQLVPLAAIRSPSRRGAMFLHSARLFHESLQLGVCVVTLGSRCLVDAHLSCCRGNVRCVVFTLFRGRELVFSHEIHHTASTWLPRMSHLLSTIEAGDPS